MIQTYWKTKNSSPFECGTFGMQGIAVLGRNFCSSIPVSAPLRTGSSSLNVININVTLLSCYINVKEREMSG
jgi:hypothetical protein